jgi:Flp pilus assembly protein TadG
MRTSRRGVAAVEFAMVAPLLCGVVLGTLEIGRAIQVQIALTSAVREGCRGYCDNPATVTFNGQSYQTGSTSYATALVQYSLKNANVGITSANIGSVTITVSTGATATVNGVSVTPATVSASMPYSLVAYSPPFVLGSTTLSASITMRKP